MRPAPRTGTATERRHLAAPRASVHQSPRTRTPPARPTRSHPLRPAQPPGCLQSEQSSTQDEYGSGGPGRQELPRRLHVSSRALKKGLDEVVSRVRRVSGGRAAVIRGRCGGCLERPTRSAGCGTCLVGSARRRDPHQSCDADQVVGGGDQIAGQSRPLQAEKACAAEATHRLHPAEDLLHAFADSLADAIAGVPRGAPINGAAATTGVLGYVWRDVAFAHVLNKVLGVVVLVATQRRRAEAVLLGLV